MSDGFVNIVYELADDYILNYQNNSIKKAKSYMADRNQLRTMASETVDPIHCRYPPPFRGQYP